MSPEQLWCMKETFSPPSPSFMLYFYEIFASLLPSHATNMSFRFVYSSPYLFLPACSCLGWVEGMASAWRVSRMLRRDITEKRSCSPNLPFPVGRVFSPQADVAGESVLGMLLCGGRSRGLVKTSWSSHLTIKCCHIVQPRFSKVTEVSELLCCWEGG